MTDLISRQAAIKALCENGMCGDKQCNAYPCEDVRAIEQVPTIDPVKHGKWELHEYPDGYYHTECSECGEVYDEMVFFSKKAQYCPNCGARMEQEDEQN